MNSIPEMMSSCSSSSTSTSTASGTLDLDFEDSGQRQRQTPGCSMSSTSTSTLTTPTPRRIVTYRNCSTTTHPQFDTEPEVEPLPQSQTLLRTNNSSRRSANAEFHFKFEDDDDTDQNPEPEATDNLLGRIRNGINIIQTHARESMAECQSEESLADMALRLEKSSLRMIKAEKSFMNTARIIAEVVDEFSEEYEHVDGNENGGESGTDVDIDANAKKNGESSSDDERVIFRRDVLKSSSITGFRDRISMILGERMTTYHDGLTDDVLREEKKFKDLQRQIRYGRRDAERRSETALDALPGGGGDGGSDALLLDSDPEEFGDDVDVDDAEMERRTAQSEEEDEYDEDILPTLDPISRRPIATAVANKFCHHVFDAESIFGFMRTNCDPKCPVTGCSNKVTLTPEQFILQEKLTLQIRAKNAKLWGADYAKSNDFFSIATVQN